MCPSWSGKIPSLEFSLNAKSKCDFDKGLDIPFECHIRMQTKRGIWGMENLDLSRLVAKKVYEFLFVYAPLKIKGATGSPGNPVAIY